MFHSNMQEVFRCVRLAQQQVLRQELQQYQLLQLQVLSMTAEELSAFLDEAQAENPLIELTTQPGAV